MSEKISQRVRFWYGIFLSVLTVGVGVMFLAEVADIYFSGGAVQGAFTAEAIRERFMHVLAPFVLWIVAIVAGFILSVVFPNVQRKKKPDAHKTLSRLRKRLPSAEGLNDEQKKDYARVRKFEIARIVLWSVSAAVCLASAIASAIYVFDKTNFSTAAYNDHVLDMAKFVLPFVAVSFACCIGTAIYEGVSAKYELLLVKKLIASGAPAAQNEYPPSGFSAAKAAKAEKWIVLGVRIAVLVLAVVFMILGTLNGGMGDVLRKAVKICTECIGLG